MNLSSDLRQLERHYAGLVREHGDAPRGAQWSSVETQRRRFSVLAGVGDLRRAKVLDFGCGTGALLDYLRGDLSFQGEYVGYDLAEPALELARKRHPDGRFERRDVLTDGIPEEFDNVLLSGVFNNRVSDNWLMVTRLLPVLFEATRRGLAFNALSTYVDFLQDDLWYADPGVVFAFCKERLSPCVTLRHDYEIKPGVVPFEFTVYVQRGEHEPRTNLA